MPKRKTVQLNLDVISGLIKTECRSYTVFCEKMGRANNWVTDWHRRDTHGDPKPKNLPSPEEAAQMCAILQVSPEEILTEQDDIVLVQGLIDSQKEKPTPVSEDGLSDDELEVLKYYRQLSPERKEDSRIQLKALADRK